MGQEFCQHILSVLVLRGSLLHSLLKHGGFLNTYISQNSVAMCFRYHGIFKHSFIANFSLSLKVTEF